MISRLHDNMLYKFTFTFNTITYILIECTNRPTIYVNNLFSCNQLSGMKQLW